MVSQVREIQIQRRYYAEIAEKYTKCTLMKKMSTFFALSFMLAVLDYLGIQSILDIGSGTGRAVGYVKEKRPDIFIVGVEPVRELREIGYSQGLSKNELIDGEATQLKFDDGQFDLVSEFGALHHIKNPGKQCLKCCGLLTRQYSFQILIILGKALGFLGR